MFEWCGGCMGAGVAADVREMLGLRKVLCAISMVCASLRSCSLWRVVLMSLCGWSASSAINSTQTMTTLRLQNQFDPKCGH
eukprot:535984-Amphidinium_carterae.1